MNDHAAFLRPKSLAPIREFIVTHWEETLRTAPEDQGTLLALPLPYTVPCRRYAFQELYYWDTYFTCLGLIASDRADLALCNTRNLLSEVARHGFVPNGNRLYYLNRSQPPYLAALVRRVAMTLEGSALLPEALPLLRREYEFWSSRRTAPIGLAHYGHHATRQELLEFHAGVASRVGLPDKAEDVLEELSHILAEAESGWDFNPRFDRRCADFCAVDLNCLLHGYEDFFAGQATDPAEAAQWARLAEERIARLNYFCWDEERGGFFDYDFVHGRRSAVVSCATFQALWSGVASTGQAARMVEEILPQLEFTWGVAACGVRPDNRRCQWDYPNGWPCLQHVVVTGLARYGYTREARRVACKYLGSVARSFQETGELWEKYNVEDGTPRTFSEGGYTGADPTDGTPEWVGHPPAMMGWTAGVFMTLLPYATNAK